MISLAFGNCTHNNMKKVIAVAVFLFAVVVSGTFGQTTADEWFKKAGEYFNSGDYANAITAYSEAIKRDSTNLDAYYFRSFAYYQIKNYDAAIADCNTVINGAPNFPTVYVARGDSYGAKGIYHKAASDYRTGLEKGYDINGSGFTIDKSSKADMWFCGAMYMEIAINRFLGKSDVVTKYENWLKTVCDKTNVTRAEVEAFYRNGIRSLISEAVDEEAAKRQPTNPTTIAEIKQIITDFFLNPTRENHNVLHQKERVYASTDGQRGVNAASVLIMAINVFNSELSNTVLDPSRLNR
jgi:tetratricopeptide (TPR) repeat protein